MGTSQDLLSKKSSDLARTLEILKLGRTRTQGLVLLAAFKTAEALQELAHGTKMFNLESILAPILTW